MSHGRHAYNRAKRRGGFDRFRRFVTGAELERLWNERGAIDADEQEEEINDEWMGEEEGDRPCYKAGVREEAKI